MKKITLAQMLKAWVVVWVSNVAGALFIVFLVYIAHFKLNGEAVANSMVSVAAGKVTVDWVTIFFAASCATSLCAWPCRWVPLARPWSIRSWAFFCPSPPSPCGFEHSSPNIFFAHGGRDARVRLWCQGRRRDALNAAGIAFNLSAATLGNIVGGAVSDRARLLVYLRQEVRGVRYRLFDVGPPAGRCHKRDFCGPGLVAGLLACLCLADERGNGDGICCEA